MILLALFLKKYTPGVSGNTVTSSAGKWGGSVASFDVTSNAFNIVSYPEIASISSNLLKSFTVAWVSACAR